MIEGVKLALLIFWLAAAPAAAGTAGDADALWQRMAAAYAKVEDYRTKVEVRNYEDDGSFGTRKFLYTFKKPQWIRLDMESPHGGTILVYPTEEGKVAVQLAGWASFLQLHLAPDSSLLRDPSGQRLNQTDMGLLIRNISRSLKDQRRGPVRIEEESKGLRLQVLAVDHFRPDVLTLYQFLLDRKLWLPLEVREGTPAGRPVRSTFFTDFSINTGVPESFFRLD